MLLLNFLSTIFNNIACKLKKIHQCAMSDLSESCSMPLNAAAASHFRVFCGCRFFFLTNIVAFFIDSLP